MVEEQAAGERSDREAHRARSRPDGNGPAALPRIGIERGDRGERGGHDQGAARTHARACGDQLPGRARHRCHQRRGAEERETCEQRQPAAPPIAERSEEEQKTGEDDRIGRRDPLQLRIGGAELRLNRRQGHVDDRVVDADEEQRKAQHRKDSAHTRGAGVGRSHLGCRLRAPV